MLEQRVLWFLASLDEHTSHWHPIIGVHALDPTPNKVKHISSRPFQIQSINHGYIKQV